jgi:flagellar basal-body rod protein FlgF
MIQGYYSAATAMTTALQNQDILAQNLAHAGVPGYRREVLSFEPNVADPNPSGDSTSLHGTRTTRSYYAFTPGAYQHTGNPLEFAIQGDGFFVLNGPNGPLYTRNGQFQLNRNGQLVSPSGLIVNGTNGPVQIPANAGNITVSAEGIVSANSVQVGQIRLASFADPRQLTRAGTTLFEAPPGVQPQPAANATIRQGYRETSNVQVIHEMVQMIAGMRQYEAAAKAMRSLADAMQQRINGQM